LTIFIAPPKYQVKRIAKIKDVPDATKLLLYSINEEKNSKSGNQGIEIKIDAGDLSKELETVFINSINEEQKKNAKIKNINVVKKSKSLIEIQSEGDSNNLCIEKINEVVNYGKKLVENERKPLEDLIKREIENYQSKLAFIKNIQIKNLDNEIDETKNQIKEIKNHLVALQKKLPKIEDDALHALAIFEVRNIENKLIEKEKELRELQIQKNELLNVTTKELENKIHLIKEAGKDENLPNFEPVGDFILDDKPAKPKKTLILAVAFVTGFILSIFLVFLKEFFKNFKEYYRLNR